MKDKFHTEATRKFWGIIFIICVILFLFNGPAYAYINPGTGSIFLQMLIGGLAGLAIVGKLYWSQIKKFFQKLSFKRHNQKNKRE